MSRLSTRKRARLPDRAFAYVDSRGRRRLPVHDKAHVKNALARFSRVIFETDAARERTRRRLLNAAKKFRIVPVGFIPASCNRRNGTRRPGASSSSWDGTPPRASSNGDCEPSFVIQRSPFCTGPARRGRMWTAPASRFRYRPNETIAA